MESRGRNKNKNKIEKFVQSIHKFFLKVTPSKKKFIFDLYFFVDYNFYFIL